MGRTRIRNTVIAAAGCMALMAAPASAATKTYAGKVEGGGKFAAEVKIKDGKPKEITTARAVDMPGECEISGKQRLDAATPEPIKVNSKGRFSYEFVQPTYGNTTTLKGKFEGKEITGVINLDLHYNATDELPEEDCATGPLDFEGEKGAPDQTE
jgi:hypothetical protein